jgi:hypothetical protein
MGRNGCGAKGSPYEEIFPPWRERKKPEDFFEILSGLQIRPLKPAGDKENR